MRIKNLNIKAFSLLEVLLASIIFIITIGGLFATLNAVRAPVAQKESALAAANYGKQALDALRSQVTSGSNPGQYYGTCNNSVDASICGDFSLYLGQHQVSTGTLSSAGVPMPAAVNALNANLTYTVTCADGSVPSGSPPGCSTADVAREVTLNITSL